MARLLGRRTDEVQADRLGTARDLATRLKAVVVLKGARTLVAAPDGTVYINPTATGALATAGSGDVLTGLIGLLLAQGLDAHRRGVRRRVHPAAPLGGRRRRGSARA